MVLADLAQALNAARRCGDLKPAEVQVIAENGPDIIPVLQEQNPLERPRRLLRGSVNRRNVGRGNVDVESDNLLGIEIGNCRSATHNDKAISRKGAPSPSEN